MSTYLAIVVHIPVDHAHESEIELQEAVQQTYFEMLNVKGVVCLMYHEPLYIQS